ncbi:chromate efflux transporter [Thioflexithrix psekupsensis]|uniref:chromate efflux transporter n=1 Tax=Thioflexithrix psekupsensis TaxID=1570016 RepID=UPI003CC99CE1
MIFLRLGATAFGGPIAHLAYFREEFVVKRRWLSERDYADVLALCQFLPGPASSQMGFSLGLIRGGMSGAVAAWVGFTLPAALIMFSFAYGLLSLEALGVSGGWLQGLKVVAVAVVAQAIWGMANTLCPDRQRITLAFAAASLMLWWPLWWIQWVIIALGGLIGWKYLPAQAASPTPFTLSIPRWLALGSGIVFLLLLFSLPLLASHTPVNSVWGIFDSFYRAGALVFGGGHVVLPLLQSEFVATGQVDSVIFLAGYGAAQAIPGPLFSLSAYLGVWLFESSPVIGALVALVAIFLPGFLLILAALPFWEGLRSRADAAATLAGINAAVVGLLIAAFYNPVWTSAILSPRHFVLALLAFLLLTVWRVSPWWVVLGMAGVGQGVF